MFARPRKLCRRAVGEACRQAVRLFVAPAPQTPISYCEMKVLGVEFAANNMNYVVIERDEAGKATLRSANRLSLSETRSGDCLRAFQGAIQTLLKDAAPDLVARQG